MKRKISVLFHYFVGYQLLYPVLLVLIAQMLFPQQLVNGYLPAWYQFLFYLLFLVGMIYMCKDFLQNEWHHFKTSINIKKWLKQLLFYFFIIYISNVVLSVILSFLTTQDTSANQDALQTMLEHTPFLTISVALVFAPIVEELVFRGVIFNFFKNKGFFIAALVSSLLFGFIHIMPNSISDIPFVVVYATMGWVIAYSYHKTGNIYTSMTLHFMNNFIALVGMFFL